MPEDSPWQGMTAAQMGHDDPHDPDRCPVCTPVTDTAAWRRGVARAGETQTHLPMTSSGDARPGRDGYEQ